MNSRLVIVSGFSLLRAGCGTHVTQPNYQSTIMAILSVILPIPTHELPVGIAPISHDENRSLTSQKNLRRTQRPRRASCKRIPWLSLLKSESPLRMFSPQICGVGESPTDDLVHFHRLSDHEFVAKCGHVRTQIGCLHRRLGCEI